MLPEDLPADAPLTWIRYARADLALAGVPLPENGMWETLCYHAQQAAEKAIKAVLLHYHTEFPSIHNIERLVALLPPDLERTGTLSAAGQLTCYAAVMRYRVSEPLVTEAEYRNAVRLADSVEAWAERVIAETSA
ncbi:MAG: HEPN domain-containing protein [Chloroflexota bacterium]